MQTNYGRNKHPGARQTNGERKPGWTNTTQQTLKHMIKEILFMYVGRTVGFLCQCLCCTSTEALEQRGQSIFKSNTIIWPELGNMLACEGFWTTSCNLAVTSVAMLAQALEVTVVLGGEYTWNHQDDASLSVTWRCSMTRSSYQVHAVASTADSRHLAGMGEKKGRVQFWGTNVVGEASSWTVEVSLPTSSF